MEATCPKCGAAEILPRVPVVSAVDVLSAVPISALAYKHPDAHVFKRPVAHPFLARICGACGYSEFYLEDPRGVAAIAGRSGDPS